MNKPPSITFPHIGSPRTDTWYGEQGRQTLCFFCPSLGGSGESKWGRKRGGNIEKRGKNMRRRRQGNINREGRTNNHCHKRILFWICSPHALSLNIDAGAGYASFSDHCLQQHGAGCCHCQRCGIWWSRQWWLSSTYFKSGSSGHPGPMDLWDCAVRVEVTFACTCANTKWWSPIITSDIVGLEAVKKLKGNDYYYYEVVIMDNEWNLAGTFLWYQ